jgi:hypothetical protein
MKHKKNKVKIDFSKLKKTQEVLLICSECGMEYPTTTNNPELYTKTVVEAWRCLVCKTKIKN